MRATLTCDFWCVECECMLGRTKGDGTICFIGYRALNSRLRKCLLSCYYAFSVLALNLDIIVILIYSIIFIAWIKYWLLLQYLNITSCPIIIIIQSNQIPFYNFKSPSWIHLYVTISYWCFIKKGRNRDNLKM